uniref:Snail family transcriptional repressor 3 n=1 Tax=Equus caballus TaxID=9796 RepID=A0A9L0R698_HORSE
MPRSFLVKTHLGHRVPNYGRLETQRETDGSCAACGGLVVPLLLPDKAAPATPAGPARPWDCTSVVARISLPLPLNREARGVSGPDPLEVSWAESRAGWAPSVPLKDSLNHLNLPPLLVLPTRWPPILGPHGDQAPDRLLGAERGPRPSGGFQCSHCLKPYHTPAGLARHRQLHCHVQAPRCFTCKYCDKEYASPGALKMHVRTHTLPCVCTLCGKAFSRPWLLQGHIRTHTGGTVRGPREGSGWGRVGPGGWKRGGVNFINKRMDGHPASASPWLGVLGRPAQSSQTRISKQKCSLSQSSSSKSEIQVWAGPRFLQKL